jgi:hypothetical protein
MMPKRPTPSNQKIDIEPAEGVAKAPCVIFAEIGPNPAPLIELIWALHRKRGMLVKRVIVLCTHSPKFTYLWRELTSAIKLLCTSCADIHLSLSEVTPHFLNDPPEVLSDQGVVQWDNQRRWQYFKLAIKEAESIGPETPVICGLVGGRRRSSSAMSVVFFQLLARQQDLCLDVRVSERAVEGARAGFYFPEQSTPLSLPHLQAKDVEVILDELQLPRFFELLDDSDRESYKTALSGTLNWSALSHPPPLLDLPNQELILGTATLKLTPTFSFYLALFCIFNTHIEDDGYMVPKLFGELRVKCLSEAVHRSLREVYQITYIQMKGQKPAQWPKALVKSDEQHEKSTFKKYTQSMASVRSKLTTLINEKMKSHPSLQGDPFINSGTHSILSGPLKRLELRMTDAGS